ncbi:neprosin family prolyl endopeptidase [Roseateles sp. DAIF2]|uniref:neprosin family prolyl endopeptidase n=1 Tax=Roseateles sp. DAIF2 TaxID=2714952 RepID=UPI0018A31A05|nr:neprosin family prolyl endopeptidase [Roseateles sp. DAIF2]QPF72252.1 neprosin family prolyl endopeptidase [Roseateles sp. DAIF2]
MARKLDARRIDEHRHEAEIRRYFKNRQARMHIVSTTRTPHGQVIDWIPRKSQLRRAERLAEPPPHWHGTHSASDKRPDRRVRFELEDPEIERGPEGTVPVLRKNLEAIRFNQPLRKLLGKYPHADVLVPSCGRLVPAPSVDGPHRYAFTDQRAICFGGDGVLSAFDPYCENDDDFSLMQIAISNSDTGRLQTVEAGWQQRKDSYGDWVPHLFTYYTTNGYSNDDDNVGGYNQDVDGWVQYDSSVHPGAISSPNSTRGGDQYVMQIKYQLWQDNWWFMCNGHWLGYYPARLFMGNRSVFSTLGDHGERISFYGEIYESNETPGKTRSDMGSGYWSEYGWQWAVYHRNLRVQTDRSGTFPDYDGTAWSSDPDMYDVESHMKSGSSWGSYCWLGGPGAG